MFAFIGKAVVLSWAAAFALATVVAVRDGLRSHRRSELPVTFKKPAYDGMVGSYEVYDDGHCFVTAEHDEDAAAVLLVSIAVSPPE